MPVFVSFVDRICEIRRSLGRWKMSMPLESRPLGDARRIGCKDLSDIWLASSFGVVVED